MMTTADAAAWLTAHGWPMRPATLRYHAARGHITATPGAARGPKGRDWTFTEADLQAFLAAGVRTPGPRPKSEGSELRCE